MLEMIKGCKIRNANELCEEYELINDCFTANVNASKIVDLMKEF